MRWKIKFQKQKDENQRNVKFQQVKKTVEEFFSVASNTYEKKKVQAHLLIFYPNFDFHFTYPSRVTVIIVAPRNWTPPEGARVAIWTSRSLHTLHNSDTVTSRQPEEKPDFYRLSK